MSLNVQTKVDKKEVEGRWFPYGETGVSFLIARAGNSAYLRASDKAEAPYRKQIARNKLSSEKQIDVQCVAMAEGILKGWKGEITAENGDALEYSTETATKLLRLNQEIREFVFEMATEQESWVIEEKKEISKK